ncbi:hypothetical protein [Vibrio superstes]|uniref:DUF3316 domain-containing protein n=1 Tax=Vibrio superstes NBRC 103154 TaxID=1219062 RepID=A0A511QR52_9VIBR|nr:hypothetical protein [Vibrio superstes]GEM79801.1 hypothetical protein VSU01S_20460 [Vibrio superstes NBRC 103154]
MKLIKKALPMIAVCSTLAFAQGAVAKNITHQGDFEDQMSQIEQVFESEVYVASDSEFNRSSVTLDIEKEMNDIYVTTDEAEALGLTKSLSFHVYSVISVQQVSDTIAKMIHRDAPTYFSVELYSNPMGRSDMVEYVAKVTEYQ